MSSKKAKGHTVVLRLTEKEKEMSQELRSRFNINISSLMRNTIRDCYKKMCGKRDKTTRLVKCQRTGR